MKDYRLTTEQLELCLPERLVKCLYELSAAGRIRAADISELRLRLNRPASVTVAGVNLPLDVRLTAAELSDAGVQEVPACSQEDWSALAGALNAIVPEPMQ